VRSPDLPRFVAERVQLGKTLDEAVETPVNLGVLGALLPPFLFRSELAKWDKNPGSFFYSLVFSNIRVPPLPLPANVERVWVRGSMPRQPGFGLVVCADGRQVTVALQYLVPAASEAGVRAFAALLEREVRESAAP
jgi:hypothetical protein